MTIRYWDTIPRRVYGLSITVSIESRSDLNNRTDSMFWVFIGRNSDSTNTTNTCYYPYTERKLPVDMLELATLKTVPDKGPILTDNRKKLYFEHKFVDTTIISTCYEFYFDSIYDFAADDTIFVGGDCRLGFKNFSLLVEYGETLNDPDPEIRMHNTQFFECDGNGYRLHIYDYDAQHFFERGSEPAVFPNCIAKGVDFFGPFFPIVQLRSTTPRQWRITARENDTARFEWQAHDDAVNFIIEVQDIRYTNEYICNTTYDTLPRWQTYYTLQGIDTTAYYRLRIQKSTRYATATYDTLVYSPWSDTITIGNFPTPPPQDTTALLTAPTPAFSLSPNPATHSTTLRLATPTTEGCHLTLTDLTGRELQRHPLPAGTTEYHIDLNTLPAATYLLTLITPLGSSTQRIGVQ